MQKGILSAVNSKAPNIPAQIARNRISRVLGNEKSVAATEAKGENIGKPITTPIKAGRMCWNPNGAQSDRILLSFTRGEKRAL